MKTADITLDELLAELQAPITPLVGFHTTMELVVKWGMSIDNVRRLLRKADECGRLDRCKTPRTNIAGITRPETVYRIKPKGGKR